MEELLLYGLALNLVLILSILIMRQRLRRLHTLALVLLLGYTIWLLATDFQHPLQLWLALSAFLLLLVAPALFMWLLRLAARARRYRLACWLALAMDLCLLQRTATPATMLDLARAREGRGDGPIDSLRQELAGCADPAARHQLYQRLLLLLMTAERYDQAVELFEAQGDGHLYRWEPSGGLLVRALGELQRWEEIAQAMEDLERSPVVQEMQVRHLFDQARMVFLAAQGRKEELDELFAGLSFAEQLPRDVVERWRQRAGDWAQEAPFDAEVTHPGLTGLVLERARQSAAMPRSLDWGPRLAPVTTALLLINLAFALAALLLGGSESSRVLARLGCAYTMEVTLAEPWRLVTSLFLHAGWIHLCSNMLALWLFGRLVEQVVGSGRFLAIYAGSALAGLALSLWLGGETLKVGASGGILGVVAGGAVLFWHQRRHSHLPAGYRKRISRGLAFVALLSLMTGLQFPMIDNWAHLGGVLGGVAVALLVRNAGAGDRRRGRGLLPAICLAGLILLAAATVAMIRYDPVKGVWQRFQVNGFTFQAPIWWVHSPTKDRVSDLEGSYLTVTAWEHLPRRGNEPAPAPWVGLRYGPEEVGSPAMVEVHQLLFFRPGGNRIWKVNVVVIEDYLEELRRYLPRILASVEAKD